jgi:2-hydroxy-4-carboxymuconate semialdehyde hemiacetal dehydrogenase
MNICMVGYGMMGVWHTEALKDSGAVLHTVVGRRAEQTQQFAERYSYRKWTVDLGEALRDPEIDIVILATPTEMHASGALASIAHGKHTLVEIPIATSLPAANQVVAAAEAGNVKLGVVHQMRIRSVFRALHERVMAGQEQVRQVCGRFYIHRLENVGATGYRRSWTDNILWHHMAHLVDVGLWLTGAPVRRVHGFMPPIHPQTGIPMEAFIGVETLADQSVICTGSYFGRERMFEVLVVTDHDSYRIDGIRNTLTTGGGVQSTATEAETCGEVSRDFIRAVREGREPFINGRSLLRTMQMLQAVQDGWDVVHGAQAIPGRPLP